MQRRWKSTPGQHTQLNHYGLTAALEREEKRGDISIKKSFQCFVYMCVFVCLVKVIIVNVHA